MDITKNLLNDADDTADDSVVYVGMQYDGVAVFVIEYAASPEENYLTFIALGGLAIGVPLVLWILKKVMED